MEHPQATSTQVLIKEYIFYFILSEILCLRMQMNHYLSMHKCAYYKTQVFVVFMASSIHPSIFYHLSRLRSRGQAQTSYLFQLTWVDTRLFPSQPRHNLSSKFRDLLPVGAWNTLPLRCPGGIRCPNPLSWLLSLLELSGSPKTPW